MSTYINMLGGGSSGSAEEIDPVFTESEAGLFVTGDKNKLDNIEDNANNYTLEVHGSNHVDPEDTQFIPIAVANTSPGLLSGIDQGKLDAFESVTYVTNITNNYTETNQTTGFVSTEDDITLSFDNGTRTLSVSPTVTSFIFYVLGTRYEKTELETIQISDVNGYWYISYDVTGALTASQTIWNLATQLPLAVIYWDNGTGTVDKSPGSTKPSKLLNLYGIAVFCPGILTDSQLVLSHSIFGSETVVLNKYLPYSIARCDVAPTLGVAFDILVNGVSKGSINFDAAATAGSFTWSTKVTLSGGDIIRIVAPTTADVTLSDIDISIVGIRE